MKKLQKALIMITLVYALPLVARPELILHYKILILAAACGVMLLTQPDFSQGEAVKHKGSDRWSVWAILTAGGLSQVMPVVEWGYCRGQAAAEETAVWPIIGLTMIVCGLVFRVWSIRTLGKAFTATVQIVEGHRLIRSGPYAIVRHPSYLGAYVAIVGAAVFLAAPIGTATAAILMAAAYHQRLAAEEATLKSEFGTEYEDYAATTSKLLPLPRLFLIRMSMSFPLRRRSS